MNIIKALLLTSILTFSFQSTHASPAKGGKLVIAGGAISKNSMEIFYRFAELSGGENANIGVIPAATGSVGKQFQLLQNAFSQAGVKLDNIHLLPLATKDDKKTKDDESKWLNNGNSVQVANDIKALTSIWFIGGDQTLITKVLLNKDGSDTKVLKQIRVLYKKGGTIGGTSAGAAIMSSIMIAGGNSQGALFNGFKESYTSMDEQEYGPAVIAKGLNFFTKGVIDQHFDRKGRLGRLIVTLLNDKQHNIGYGIDEGTAMLVEGNEFSVIGEGGVTVVDTSNVNNYKFGSFPVNANNVRLSFVQTGDRFNLHTLELTKRNGAVQTVGHEYFRVPAQSVSGLVNGNRNLDQFIGYDLLDNKATQQITSWLIEGEQAIKMTFSQDTQTLGYWSTDVTADVYSFVNVKMDITPLKITVSH
ncbi:MAG: cyanophycinase [Gammaproteobacteria bacterium]|nr:cyanophycinase [Gammaproteobacteria bacterium]